jgi:hypothetical protein
VDSSLPSHCSSLAPRGRLAMEPDPPVVTGSSEADGHQGVLFPSLGGPDFASFSALGDVDRTLPPSLFATTTANASFTLRPVDSAQSSPRSRTISTTPGTSSPRRRARSATPEVDSASSLVADVQMTRSRLIISKTATLASCATHQYCFMLMGIPAVPRSDHDDSLSELHRR